MITRPFGRTGVRVPVIGQGTWRMGEDRSTRAGEVAALRLGLDLGLTHIVGYTPLARGGFARGVVADIAARHGRTPRQVALNFLMRRPGLFTIPKAGRPEHVRENAAALDFTLSRDEVAAIDGAFPDQ